MEKKLRALQSTESDLTRALEASVAKILPRNSVESSVTRIDLQALEKRIDELSPLTRGFKVQLEDIEKDLTALRVSSTSEIERVNAEIRKVDGEISMAMMRDEPVQTPMIVVQSTQDDTETPVQQFQSFLNRNGGRTGGWDQISHQKFLRVMQTGDKARIPSEFPDVPEGAVWAHYEFMKQFLDLKDKMKAYLDQKTPAPVEKKPVAHKVDSKAVMKRIEERDSIRRKKNEAEREAMIEKQKMEEDAKRKKFRELRKELKKRPIKPKEFQKPVEEKVIKVYKQSEWEKINQRNQDLAERKQQILQKREEDSRRKEERRKALIEKESTKYANVTSRVTDLPPTPRKREKSESKPVNSVFDIPHRATPAWML